MSRQVDTLQTVLAGVAAQRSTRERGHEGLVQGTGHRSTVEFIRDLTGMTRNEAIRTVKTGEALLETAASEPGSPVPEPGPPVPEPVSPLPEPVSPLPEPVEGRHHTTPWHQPLTEAMLTGVITSAQHDAIRRGLGSPPVADDADLPDADAVEAWRAAAAQLLGDAATCTVEDLRARARAVRDLADPEGAQDRHAQRFASRSYRTWLDEDGLRHGRIVYDPEMGERIDHLFRTALAPRRGGPRFVADDERAAAEALSNDPRTNEQLQYDLLVDLICTGAKANHTDVFGAKEAGIRLITLRDTVSGENVRRDVFGRLIATACTDDGQLAVPGSTLEKALCVAGTVNLVTDTSGNPLDLGRDARLYDKRQRLAIAARDGGCVWPGCDRPPAMCEAHHIDPWSSGGATDCDRGVLLCRFHHLHLHNDGWRITRSGKDPFRLHAPPQLGREPIALKSKSPLRWLWDPPDRARWRIPAESPAA